MARMEAKQHKTDLGTVQDAAHVNQLFGGSFSDGVGSNTWAHTPFQKYDYKDRARMESLKEVSPEKHAEMVKCMQLAMSFKGAKKGYFAVTEEQKKEAVQCMHVAMHKAWKGKAKRHLALDTSLDEPKMARPNDVHIFRPNKELLEKRAKFMKKEKILFEKREAEKAEERKDAMHPHIIKAKHFFRHKKVAGAEVKVLAEAKKARKELKLPDFVKTNSFDDRQGARQRDKADVQAKLSFWEGMGSEKEKLQPSHDRSKTEYIVTDPMAGARKAHTTSKLLEQKTTMLHQVRF